MCRLNVRIPFQIVLSAAAIGAAGAAGAVETWRDTETGMAFVHIPKGCYKMGVPSGGFADQDTGFRARIERTEGPAHEVCVDEFWMGQHEVTEGQWRKIMPPRPGGGDEQLPATELTREDATTFARHMTKRGPRGWQYRLPTEAEWEYACRAGQPAAMEVAGPVQMDKNAWYSSRYDLESSARRYRTPQPVGGKAANAFGLHDMLGNVWEWTQDGYADDAYRHHVLFNPRTAASRDLYAVRGGSIRSDRRWMRCEGRTSLNKDSRLDTVGFRLVRVPTGEK